MKTPPLLLVVLAGPNGAGKSTFYERHLSNSKLPFINPDWIARELFGALAAAHALEGARIAEQRRRELVAARRSFIFETVFSDPVGDKVSFLVSAHDEGYFVDAHFIGLASPALSQLRVFHRVGRGGHDVPDEKIFDRYPRTLRNLILLIPVADRLTIYDNSEIARPHRPFAVLERGCLVELSSEIPDWAQMLNLTALATAQTKQLL